MIKKNIKLIPFFLTAILIVHICVNPIWFLENDWSYVETSLMSLPLSLCNSIPYFYKIFRTKNTKSYPTSYLLIKVFNGGLGLFIMLYNFYRKYDATILTICLLRWIPDIIGSVIGFCIAIMVIKIKIKNIIQKKEIKKEIKIKWKKIFSITLLFAITISFVSIYLFIKIENFNQNSLLWLYICSIISSLISISNPLILSNRIIKTEHVKSISLYSKLSLLSAMVCWTTLDLQSLIIIGIENFIPTLFSDGITIFWTILIIFQIIHNNKLSRNNYLFNFINNKD
ncbi:MAG: hypothetical protein LBD05_02880 [Mycoplasmataceae bacterium]|jgi:hypothetical protein|nr:hypothetical protein [Mycoplasmataceae bacterium]